MFEFISFGSGSSGNCYYFRTAEGAFLIDAGVGIRQIKKYFREYGLIPTELKAILITHDHADHVKALGLLSTEYKIPVFATEEVVEGIRKNPTITKKPESKFIHYILKDEPLPSIAGCCITPFDVPHDSNDNVGYCIEYDGRTFCLITDAGCITETMETYINRANNLVLEANYDATMLANGPYPAFLKERIASCKGHLCNTDSALAIKKFGNKHLHHVWLCHLSEENNHPELAKKTIERCLEELPDHNIEITVLKRRSPSGFFEL